MNGNFQVMNGVLRKRKEPKEKEYINK